MGRAERPLDQGHSGLLQFAADLRRLRRQAGSPPYRELGRRAHYAAGTLSDAAGGRRLPSLAVTTAFVRACDGDVADWTQRWHAMAAQLAAEAVAEPPSADGAAAPYVGLAAFQPEDADRFFGRQALVEHLVDRVGRQRFLAVLGASGVGKTSLLRAGLIAHARNRGWPVVAITPGSRPMEECAIRLASLTGESAVSVLADLSAGADRLHLRIRQVVADRDDDVDLLLVVDQFEEVFALCHDPAEAARFVEALLTAAQYPTSRTRVVVGVRTDFYFQCSQHTPLAEAMRNAQLLVGPLTAEGLRDAIVQPAVRAGYTVEGALLAAVVAESAGQAGALPLVSHAMRETWSRRRGTTLTLAGYLAAGGIQHALSHTAEATYDRFSPAQRRLTKQLFLRLTATNHDAEHTRRRIRRDELPADSDAVLTVLAEARLVMLDGDNVEMTHEALIQWWPRLRDWLAEDRDGHRVHRHLTEAAEDWISLDRDTGALYRGARLELARSWAASNDPALNDREREFLRASIAADTVEQAPTRRLRLLMALLAVLLLGVAGDAAAATLTPSLITTKAAPAHQVHCSLTGGFTTITTDHGAYCYDGDGEVQVNQVRDICAGDRTVTLLWSSADLHNRMSTIGPHRCRDFENTPGDTWIHRIRVS